MIKDIEDIKRWSSMRTLPIVIGLANSTKLCICFEFYTYHSFFYVNKYFVGNGLFITAYSFIFVLGPLFYFTIKLSKKTKEDFPLSSLLKHYSSIVSIHYPKHKLQCFTIN
jgi:4-hydroxybenzoate polyprenyltransferase